MRRCTRSSRLSICPERAGRAGCRSVFARSLPSDLIRGGNRFASRKRVNSRIQGCVSSSSKRRRRQIARSAVQHKSSMKARARDAGRNASAGLGSSGMIVMVHAAGTLDLFSTIDRTWPVTADPDERTVAVLPLNWAIRKRRTSFRSLDFKREHEGTPLVPATILSQRYPEVKISNRSSTAGPHRRREASRSGSRKNIL